MENNKTGINTPISTPQVKNIVPQAGIVESTTKKKTNPFILILVFIIVLLLGVMTYLFLTDKIDLSFMDKKTVLKEKEESKDLEASDPKVTKDSEMSLKTFTYDNPKWIVGFTLQYPENWEISKDETTCSTDPVTNKEICERYELILSLSENPKYFIHLGMCLECSPGFACAYSDSDYTQEYMDDVNPVMFDSFEEFGDGKFRRGSTSTELNGILGDLIICEKSDTEDSNSFDSSCEVETVSNISYGLDDNPDEEIIDVMDEIILSLERVAKN